MATVEVTPTGTAATGRVKVGFFAGTLAVAGAISLASDIGHTGFLNVSFYIPGSDWGPTGAQNKGQDVRLGAVQTFDALGLKSWTINDLTYIEDVTGPGTGVAKGLLVPDTIGVLVVRWGTLATVDWALAQRAYAFPITLGMRWPVRTTTDEFGKLAYQQVVGYNGGAVEDVAITT